MGRLLKMADACRFGSLFPAKSITDQETRNSLEDYYRNGDRTLAEELGVELAKYGYPV